jgi:hypothetical protein
MAWTTPSDWTAGVLVTVADFNAQLSDNHSHLKTALDSSGRLTALSSTYVADLSGVNLTGVMRLAYDNVFTAGKTTLGGTSRIIVPVGADKWGV